MTNTSLTRQDVLEVVLEALERHEAKKNEAILKEYTEQAKASRFYREEKGKE